MKIYLSIYIVDIYVMKLIKILTSFSVSHPVYLQGVGGRLVQVELQPVPAFCLIGADSPIPPTDHDAAMVGRSLDRFLPRAN